MRHIYRLALTAVVAAGLLAPSTSAAGQAGDRSWTVPRTPDGQPDLQGVWANNTATPFERPEALADKTSLNDEELAALKSSADRLFGAGGDAAFGDGVFEAALRNADSYVSSDGGSGNYSTVWMVDRDFDNRTSLITDPSHGRLPLLTPDAETRADARSQRGRSPMRHGPEDLSLQVRCITYSIPRIGGIGAGYNSYYQIFQSSEYVAIYSEMIHDVRIIPLDSYPHIGAAVQQWHGDSRGHWEADTLVIETSNFSPKSLYRGSSSSMNLVERLTRVGPDTVHYEITVTDPTIWTQPWTAMAPLKRSEDAVYEYACQEGNIGMAGILSGARAEERASGVTQGNP